MKLSELIKNAVFGTIATITGEESLNKAYGFVQYNMPVLTLFDTILVSINWVDKTYLNQYKDIWYLTNKNVIFIEHEENLGHVFGTIELEESLLKCVKTLPNKNWLFKSTEDILLSTKIFTKDFKEASFYYLPGFSYETTQKFKGEDFYKEIEKTPQTNFYIINTVTIDHLYPSDITDKRFFYIEHGQCKKPWEIVYPNCDYKFDMETMLGLTTKYFLKEFLISFGSLNNLLTFVLTNKVGDPSHKQILLNEIGVCHYHNPSQGYYTID